MKKAAALCVAINQVNALHQELHHLRAANQAARPTKQGEFPDVGATAAEEIAHNALAARGKKFGEVADGIEERGAAADPSGSQAYREEQRGKKGEENVKRDGLGNHAATRKDALERAPKASGKPSLDRHRWTL